MANYVIITFAGTKVKNCINFSICVKIQKYNVG